MANCIFLVLTCLIIPTINGEACLSIPDAINTINESTVDITFETPGRLCLGTFSTSNAANWENVLRLHSDNGHFTAIEDDAFQLFASLETLSLENNKIHAFPKLIGLNHTLQRLQLKGNMIINIPKEDLKGFPQLTYLDLSGNKLTKFPEFPTTNNISELHLGDNNIPSVTTASLVPLQAITMLTLKDNNIDTFPVIPKLVELSTINLYGNKLTEVTYAQRLSLKLDNLPQLKELILGNQKGPSFTTMPYFESLLAENENLVINFEENSIERFSDEDMCWIYSLPAFHWIRLLLDDVICNHDNNIGDSINLEVAINTYCPDYITESPNEAPITTVQHFKATDGSQHSWVRGATISEDVATEAVAMETLTVRHALECARACSHHHRCTNFLVDREDEEQEDEDGKRQMTCVLFRKEI